MAKDLRFHSPIPGGMRILAPEAEVVGIQHRLSEARSFAEGENQRLELEPEPDNPHDPNAIKVIGIYEGSFLHHRVHLGYVEASLAQTISSNCLSGKILPRLKNIWWGGYERDYIVVRFDILEPKPPRLGRTAKRPSVVAGNGQNMPA